MGLPVWNYLKGYVIIKASGLSAGKFINLSAFYGIELWDIKNNGRDYFMKADIQNADELKEISRKSGCRTEIIKKCGMPVLYEKVLCHKAYAAGMVMSVLIVYFLSLFVWNINFEGNYKVSTESLKKFCAEKGIYEGVPVKSIDTLKTANEITAHFDDIAWSAVNTKGTDVFIAVSETIDQGSIIDNQKVCDIVSDVDGVIESITVISGTPLVRSGDVVKKGDVLVSGTLDIKDGDEVKGHEYVKAEAYIRTVSLRNIKFKINRSETEKIYTGRESRGIDINFFENQKYFYLPNDFKNYDKVKEYTFKPMLGGYAIPFGFEIYNIREYINKEKILSDEETEKKAESFISSLTEENLSMGDYIIKEDKNINKGTDYILYDVYLTISKQTGVEKEFVPEENENIRGELD